MSRASWFETAQKRLLTMRITPLILRCKFRHGHRPMTNHPFFTRDREAFIPTQAASGPWDPKSLHGRVIIGLLAFVIEQRHGGDDFVPARLTVDMFRLPNFAPIEVKTRLVRDGRIPRCRRRIRHSRTGASAGASLPTPRENDVQ